MKILVVGNGAREHALLWKLRRDAPEAELFVTVGNGGTGSLATHLPIGPMEIQALAGWAKKERVDLTIVGPEVPLAEGVVDHFSGQGIPIFGPSRAAAEIESSKAFAKGLMRRNEIPTAGFEVFTELAPAAAYIRTLGAPLVVKASGLASGKGAVVCETEDEALATAAEILSGGAFGSAGARLVVEEFMRGEEISVFALCDEESFVTLVPAQDHKRIGEGDSGPNTGGMGAYAPVSVATPPLIEQIEEEILRPTLLAMADVGRPYRGVLYLGAMLTDEGPKVVEFNARFGDPETEVLLPMLRTSLIDLALATIEGRLASFGDLEWFDRAAVTTVMASGGYPGDYRTGVPITIPAELQNGDEIIVFHAGTSMQDGSLVTSGGRVLAVTALGADVAEAAERSRAAAELIEFTGRTFRRDIGWREIARA